MHIFFNNLVFIIAIVATTLSASAITIYQSVGKHGEKRYSQLPPQVQYTTLDFYQPKEAPTNNPTHQKQCQTLRHNLAALTAGSEVHEVDKHGTHKALSGDEIRRRIAQTQEALNTYCQVT